MRNKILIPLLFVAVRGSVSAAQITFSAGNPAVAADVNANFTELYNAKWTLTGSDLSYSAGNIGIGVANPGVKLGVVGGSAVTLAGATGFGVFGATTGNHVAIDSTQIQAKSNATTAASLALNPLGGNVAIGMASSGVPLDVNGDIRTSGNLRIDKAAGNARMLNIFTANSLRWAIGANGIAEGGSNAGSNFAIQRYDDAGTFIDNALVVTRAAGLVGINNNNPGEILDVGGNIKSSGKVIVTGADQTERKIEIQTAGVRRWSLGADAGAEDGTPSNDGSNFEIRRFQDGGGTFGNPIVLKFTRSSGLLQLPLYNVGTLTSDASGNITVSSDGRMKDIVGKTETGLSEVLQMYGKRWRWKPGMGMETQGVYEGFIAQDVERLVPLAVGGKADGMKSLAYHALLPTFANAIRELKSEKDTQVLALEKRAAEAEQKYAALLKQMQHEKAQADARAAKLELRLARLEASLEKNRVVARR
ncbi:MAG: tail fiber domain-containing protein [Turneriella sp.]